jgi:hypothetical protein
MDERAATPPPTAENLYSRTRLSSTDNVPTRRKQLRGLKKHPILQPQYSKGSRAPFTYAQRWKTDWMPHFPARQLFTALETEEYARRPEQERRRPSISCSPDFTAPPTNESTSPTPPTAQELTFDTRHIWQTTQFTCALVDSYPRRRALTRQPVIANVSTASVNTDLENINEQATHTSAAINTVTSALNVAHP